jgi:hypothetical protein
VEQLSRVTEAAGKLHKPETLYPLRHMQELLALGEA